MAAPVPADAISFHEEQVTSILSLTVQSTNLMANFDASSYPPSIQILVEGLKHSVLFNAFTIFKSMPLKLVSLAFSTAIYLKNEEAVKFEVAGGKKFFIRKSSFARLIGLPTDGIFVTPTAEELVDMFNSMGYSPPLTKISQFKKNKLPVIWNVFFTFFKRCLTGRKGGQDSASQQFLQFLYGVYNDVNVDFGSILWHEFVESLKISTKDVELSCHRFWSVILESVYREKRIPYNADEEPQMVSISLSIPSKLYDQVDNSVVGVVPEAMLNRIPTTSTILLDYRSPVIKPIPHIQDPGANKEVKRTKKRKEQVTIESPSKPQKQLKKGDDVQEGSSQQSILKRLKKKPKSHTPNFEKIKRSKHRRQILTDDQDDDILPISQVFSIGPLINVIDPIAEEQVGVHVNEENMELVVQNLEEETAQDETMLVRTEVVNEEEMGDEETRIENETVGDEVVQAVAVTTVGEETVLVESEGVPTNVSDMVVHQTVVTEAVTTEVRAPVVNEEIDATEEYMTVNLQVVNESEEDTNEEFDHSCSVTPPIPNPITEPIQNTISEPITHTVSEPIPNPTSESSIFSDLRNLNVTLPVISPVIPPVTEEATILEDISDGEFIGLSDNEEFELAPIQENNDDMDDDANDDQFISMKQFKILNQKLNMIIRYQDLPKEKELQKETEIESVVLNFHEKLETQSQVIKKLVNEFDDFKKIMNSDVEKLKDVCEEMKTSIQQLDNTELKVECSDIKDKIQILKDLSVQGDENVKSLREELLHLQGMYENEVKKKLDEAVDREGKLQKIVDESIAHIKVLEESIKTYDEKAIAEEYNEKVVKHVEMVQQDFIARLSPLINFVKRIPKPKEGTSEVTVTKPFRKMDLHLFKSTVDTSLPYFNPSTTAEPHAILKQLTFPMVTQPQPEAAIRALDAGRLLTKGVVIGSSIPLMTTSTIVSTIGEGSSITGKGKGKQVVIELSKEEKKTKEAEEVEKLKQKMSLIRQGDSEKNLDIIGESKIWTETTIRDVAFGEDEYFNMLPKLSYDVDLSSTQQLDLPLMPKLFKVKCFMVKASLQMRSGEYEEKLIRFYGSVGKPETEVWNSNPIVRVLKVTNAGVFDGVFENKRFKVLRTDNKEYDFTMADFPTMNPLDLIRLFKLFNCTEKVDVIIFVLHLKKLLKAYVEKLARKDMLVSKELFIKLDNPDIRLSGISKEKDGKIIHKPEWGVVSSAQVKGKIVKSFMRMDEKGLFDTAVLESMLRRIHQNDENSVKEKRDVEDQLRWWLAVRKEILSLIPVLYAKG